MAILLWKIWKVSFKGNLLYIVRIYNRFSSEKKYALVRADQDRMSISFYEENQDGKGKRKKV